MFRRVSEIHNNIGIINYFYGKTFRKLKYISMQKKYGFDKWHILPIQIRQYAWDIAKMINENPDKFADLCVAEIGCGLGDIIRTVNVKEKYGVDLSKEVLEAAEVLDTEKKINWINGSFDEVAKLHHVDMLITVNFMHEIEPEALKEMYARVVNNNDIKYVIADSTKGYQYKYWHDFGYLLPGYKVLSEKTYCYNRRVYLLMKDN